VKVTVRSMGLIRQALGGADFDLDLPAGARLPDLLAALVEQKGEKAAPFLRETKQPTPYSSLRIAVNGADVSPSRQREHVLADGDDVLIFSPIAGG
jgi:molybdopterin converting factor small subunit